MPLGLRAWVYDAAERGAYNAEFVAIPAIVALAATVGSRVGVFPKQFDDWFEVPNLWGMIVAPPSSGKTPAMQEGLRHLRAIAARSQADHGASQHAREIKAARLQAQYETLHRQAISGTGDPTVLAKQLDATRKELDALQAPAPQWLASDVTIEKLIEILRDNPTGILLYRDELAALLDSCEKPGREGDRGFLLEGWNGKGSYRFERVGRGTIYVPRVTLSLLGSIQPGVVSKYVRGATAGSHHSDGLLQRFQLTVWPDETPPFKLVDRPPDRAAIERSAQVFRSLERLDLSSLPTALEESTGLPGLRFSGDAQDLFNEWVTSLMQRVRSPDMNSAPALQAHLSKFRSLAPKLALLFHLVNVADGGAPGPISLAALRAAIDLCTYLESHAVKLYGEPKTQLSPALALAQRIENHEVPDGINVRELQRRQWPRLTTGDEIEEALRDLANCHWVRVESVPNPGARPSRIIRLNPGLAASTPLN